MSDDPIRILSIDGGGILGLIPLVLMQRLQGTSAGFDLDKVDLFAGTSTGGIIALSLAAGIGTDKVRALYEDRGEEIFKRSFWHRLGLFGPRYTNKNLKRELQQQFGEKTLEQLPKKVLVPAFDLDNEDKQDRHWRPVFFGNFESDYGKDMPAYKAALATSAAPTYFPTYRGYIDGGMVANNPSLAAVARVLEQNPDRSLKDVRVLSFATYGIRQYVKGSRSFGLFGVKTIVDILLNGSERVVDYQCKRLLGESYRRVCAPYIPRLNLSMDDVKDIPSMIALAERTDLDPVKTWLAENWT